MARAIDGDELLGIERLLDTGIVRQSKTASWLLDQVLHDIQAMPTLTPPNEPLTQEQLREMDGEPVYIHSDIFPEDCGWRVIARADVLRIYFTDRTSLSLTDYGKSWIAYRRPPEGEE